MLLPDQELADEHDSAMIPDLRNAHESDDVKWKYYLSVIAGDEIRSEIAEGKKSSDSSH